MNDQPRGTREQLLARINHLEELFTHLQRTMQEVSDMVVKQQRRSDQIDRELARLVERLQAISESETTATDLADERPPHY